MPEIQKWLIISLAVLCSGSSLLAQGTLTAAKITVQVGDKPALVFTEEELGKLSRHTLTVKEHDAEVSYSGVLLREVLQGAGAPFGAQLRGKALSSYVLATARDGYAVVYTLAEMDPDFTDAPDVMIADRLDGKPLTEQQGPLRIVVPHDKKPARSLRMLDRIEVVQLRK